MTRLTPRRHAGFQGSSRPVLSLRVGTVETPVAVVCGPVVFIMAVGFVDRILGLISTRIDERKRLAGHDRLGTDRSIAVQDWRVCYSLMGMR